MATEVDKLTLASHHSGDFSVRELNTVGFKKTKTSLTRKSEIVIGTTHYNQEILYTDTKCGGVYSLV